jgi:UDP-glucose:glycoprotein glucosyltransferase
MSCSSNTEKALNFLHGLCKFYDGQHIASSSALGDSISMITDKVYSLAAENALPVDDYKAWLTSFSADTVLKGIDKVSI